MSEPSPIWLTEAEIVSLIDLGEAVTAVRSGLATAAAGEAASMPKAQLGRAGASLHATGAISDDGHYACAKTWIHTPGGATPMLLLWSSATGALLAVMEAFAIGQYRTGAVSAVATDVFAKAGARTMAICGTGSQALMQVAAVAAIRKIDHVRIWSPNPDSRDRFAVEVENALAVDTSTHPTPAQALERADIVTLMTRAKAQFVEPAAVPAGAHVNAVGAIGLDRMEFDPELLSRCAVVSVDSMTAARAYSRELREHYGEHGDWAAVTELAEAVTDASLPAEELTLFKAMGVGLGDLSIATFCYEQALINQLGQALPTPSRSRPRLRSSLVRS